MKRWVWFFGLLFATVALSQTPYVPLKNGVVYVNTIPGSCVEGDSPVLIDIDDGVHYKCSSTSYVAIPGGVADHGGLTGLSDDDHPQYALDTDLTTHTANASAHHAASTECASSSCDLDAATTIGGLSISTGSHTSATPPGGSDTYVQYNDGGSTFGGEDGFEYDKVQDTLSAVEGRFTCPGGPDSSLGFTLCVDTTDPEGPALKVLIGGQVFYVSIQTTHP